MNEILGGTGGQVNTSLLTLDNKKKGKRFRRRGAFKELKKAFTVYVRIARNDSQETGEGPLCQADLRTQETGRTVSNEDRRALLEEFADVFLPPNGRPPPLRDKFKITIEPGAKAPYRNAYRLSRKEEEELRRQVEKAMDNGWVVPSNSEYGAPVLFVPKKDGTLRMCIDYRPLNAITTKDRYPLPAIEDLMDQLQGAKIFSKLDLAAGYHQMEVGPNDQHKTAFVTKFGLFEWRVLPFGLANGPGVFMRMMAKVFDKEPEMRNYVVFYLDDILIYSKTVAEHKTHLRKVL